MSATRSTPQRLSRRSTRSPPHPTAPSATQFTSFNAALTPASSKPTWSTIASDSPKIDPDYPNRPPLPLEKKNPLLASYRGRLRSVKTQKIPLDNDWTVTIARVKVPTSNGAAGHLIKRFDTNAISATSFFRAAFPDASEEEVDTQMAYISKIWDTDTAGGHHIGPECKLTGTWAPIEHAEVIAEWYGLSKFANELISFPEPNHVTAPNSVAHSSGVTQIDSSSGLFPESPSRSNPSEVSVPRSSKRPRVAPPSFGNTSPSRFSLPPPAPPQGPPPPPPPPVPEAITRNQNLPAGDEADPTEEPMTISNDEADEPEQKTVKVTVTETSSCRDGPETVTMSTASVVGTDEQVELAKRDALSLVASLQESAASVGASSPATVSSSEMCQKKRGFEDVEDVHSGTGKDKASTSLPSRGFFGRFWPSKHAAIAPRTNQIDVGHQSRDIAPLPAALLPRVTPVTKRNLAVAGIVVAGAAASIAPYFF